MRVLAFSDVHGDQSIIAKIKQKAKDCDLILCCGDITPAHGIAIDAARQIGKFHAHVLAIPGNFETPSGMGLVCKELGWIDLHGKSIEIQGLLFFGCGGGNIGPFNTPYELTEEQFKEILHKFDAREKFVFVSHCPSKGFLDKVGSGLHVGSAVIGEFVKEMQPLYQFCGHIHEEGGKESLIGRTKVYNVARQVKVLDIE
ncbi:MAG: metallophosphoesterase family protein [Nitrososphaerales archaeon]